MSEPLPFSIGNALPPQVFERVRLRTIFECCKFDPQVEDVSVLAPFPILITTSLWAQLSAWAEELARETLMAERSILARVHWLKHRGLPRPNWKLLASGEPPDPYWAATRIR